MNEVVQSKAIKFGLIAAALSLGYMLYAYVIDLNLFVNFYAGIVLWLIMMVLFIIGVSQAKKAFNGIISFKNAFSTFTLAYIISAVISSAFSILLFVVIDPEAANQIQELTIEKSVEMMQQFGTPESAIDEQVESMEGTNNFDTLGILKSLLSGIVIYSIIGLIVAAIMKKKESEFS